MGLDMYLNANGYYGGWRHGTEEEKSKYDKAVTTLGLSDFIDEDSPSLNVSFPVGYWRKANAIHGWFHRNCGTEDNDVSFPVTRTELQKLKEECQKALWIKPAEVPAGAPAAYAVQSNNFEQAIGDLIRIESHSKEFNDESDNDPLRPVSGFFFGSTEKDEWYYMQLEETIKICDKALSMPKDFYFSYNASY